MTPKKFRAVRVYPRGNYVVRVEWGTQKYLQSETMRDWGKQLLSRISGWTDRKKHKLRFARILGQSGSAGDIYSNISDYHSYFNFGKRYRWFESSYVRRANRTGLRTPRRMKLRLFHFLCTKEMRTDSCNIMNIPKRRLKK